MSNELKNLIILFLGVQTGEALIAEIKFSPTMSINQWKMISHIRDHLTKSVSDKTSAILNLNKDWVSAVKKIPVLNGNFSSDSEEGTKNLEANTQKTTNASEVSKTLSDFKSKLTQKVITSPDEKLSWKSRKNLVSDLSIAARTNYILTSIENGESDAYKVQRLEVLLEHFYRYPEGIRTAVKAGAVPKLLKIRNYTKDSEIKEVISEALAVLGYINPLPSQGIRILAIDGGGIRGLLVMEMLAKLEELTGKKINELFDYICGVSTGSVIACTIGASGKSIEEIAALYRDLSNKIFNQNVFFGARSLIWNHGYYDTAMWEKLLKEHVGEIPLIKTSRNPVSPKVCEFYYF